MLEARNLTLEIEGRRLVDSVDLTLRGEEVTVILGFNGAGKSLLLRLLHGLIPATAGGTFWNGEHLSDAVRQRQAMVFQKPVLLRRSVLANVDFALRARGLRNSERSRQILEFVGLKHMAKRPARLLSGGEQQRLALARALVCDPEVLFLDEPAASLDPASTIMIEDAVSAARDQGTKIILVTHDIGQARRIADEIVFLHHGKVVEQGPADKFFTKPSSEAAQSYLEGRLLV